MLSKLIIIPDYVSETEKRGVMNMAAHAVLLFGMLLLKIRLQLSMPATFLYFLQVSLAVLHNQLKADASDQILISPKMATCTVCSEFSTKPQSIRCYYGNQGR